MRLEPLSPVFQRLYWDLRLAHERKVDGLVMAGCCCGGEVTLPS